MKNYISLNQISLNKIQYTAIFWHSIEKQKKSLHKLFIYGLCPADLHQRSLQLQIQKLNFTIEYNIFLFIINLSYYIGLIDLIQQ